MDGAGLAVIDALPSRNAISKATPRSGAIAVAISSFGTHSPSACEERSTLVLLADYGLSQPHTPPASAPEYIWPNINYKSASLYEAFPAAQARHLVERFEWHYSPKLNMAESELAVLSGQCLDRRIPDRHTLEREVDAWQDRRNTHNNKADWRFTTADARIKLKSLYPAL